jgi:hypothetical protein
MHHFLGRWLRPSRGRRRKSRGRRLKRQGRAVIIEEKKWGKDEIKQREELWC